mmetsp:Transcript_82450/g.214840  ORF Transcript_82450/g.214840 Transcript_82450/m.214840 type:complete len:315 (-) Transcript_82450:57-1001(-)
MGKKKELAGSDKFLKYCYLLAIPLTIVSIIPYVPWRRKEIDPNFHSRFAMMRYVSLMSMSDKMGKMQPFSKWKRNMCANMQMYMQPNLGGELASMGAGLLKSTLDVSTPSTLLGCQQWPPCKEMVSGRCQAYTVLFMIGMCTVALMIISAILNMVVVCCLTSELQAKKKKDKAAAALKVYGIAVTAFVLNLGMNVTWQTTSIGEFRSLQNFGYFPVPHAFVGPYIAGAGAFLQGLGLIVRTYKQFGPKPSKDNDDDAQDAGGGDAYGGAAGYPPPGAYPPPPADPGMPPALMGGAPPPPMMAQPGYAMPPPPPM